MVRSRYDDDSRSLLNAFHGNDPNAVRQILQKRPHTRRVDSSKRVLINTIVSVPRFKNFQLFLALSDSPIFDIDADSVQTHKDATGLHLACSNIRMEYVERFLQEGVDPHERLLETYSVLYYAVRTNNLRIVETFLNCPENINYAGPKGCTALYLSDKFRHVDVCRILLEKGADPRSMNEDRELPLHWACKNKHADIARLLVWSDLTTINHQDKDEMTPLMLAAKNCHSECVRMLLDYGAKVEICDSKGQTALHFLVQMGNAKLLKLMLERADASSVEKETWNFLRSLKEDSEMMSLTCCAIVLRNIKCLKLLVTSKLSKSFLQMPHIPYQYVIYSPLADLLSRYEYVSDWSKLDPFLQVLLKYKITMIHDHFHTVKLLGRRSFQHPLSFILKFDLSSSQIEKHFNLLIENDITVDYCLHCYHDNSQPFSSFTDYYKFYELLTDVLSERDVRVLKLVMSNSVILEPEEAIVQLISLSRFSSVKVETFPDKYEYLISLKPNYFMKENRRNPEPEYPYLNLKEEFSKLSLQQLCRTVIRHHLRDYTLEDNLRNFKKKILELPLPALLKGYLLFKY